MRKALLVLLGGCTALLLCWPIMAQTVPSSMGGGGGIAGSGVAGRCALWSSATALTSDSGCAYTGTGATLALAIGGSVSGPIANFTNVTGGNVTDSALTAGRVTFAGTAGLLADDSDMTFLTDTLTVTKLVTSTSITDSGTLSIAVGSQSLPAIYGAGDATSGIYFNGSGRTLITSGASVRALFQAENTAANASMFTVGNYHIGFASGVGSADDIAIGRGSVGNLAFTNGGTTTNVTIGSSGISTNNVITSSRTTDLGWSVVAGANTACNTTCTNACVFGEDTSVIGTVVGCTDASADLCVCAGSN